MDKTCEWHICDKKVNAGGKFCSKNCRSKYAVDRRRKELKLLAVEYKGGKCFICGYNLFVSALDFHHIDASKKDFGLSAKGMTNSWEKVKKEIEKCVLLCCRCHREVHEGLHFETLNEYHKELIQGKHTFDWGLEKTNRNEKNKIIRKKLCFVCESLFSPSTSSQLFCSKKCSLENRINSRKVKDRPSKEELQIMISEMSWVGIGRKYGVSDNSVRKWAKKYELI